MINQAPVAPAGPQSIDRYFQKMELIIRQQNVELLKVVLNNPLNEENLKAYGFYLLELAEHYRVSQAVLTTLASHACVIESTKQSDTLKQAWVHDLVTVLPDWDNPLQAYALNTEDMSEQVLLSLALRPR